MCFQTIWQHSSAQVILAVKILHPILSVCSSQSNESMYNSDVWLSCTCYSSQMPFSRLKCGKKLRNMSPSRFVSTALRNHCYRQNTIASMLILSVCSGQSNVCIQNSDFGYTLTIVLLLKCLL